MARQRAILMICIICAALLRLTSARDLLATQGILSSRQAQALPANSTRPLSIKAGPTVAAAGQAVGFSWRTVVNLDCTATCANAGTRAINGGTLNQGMCGLMYQGVAYYGLWRPSNKKCQFIMNSQSWASSGGYSCACTLPSGGELNWEANSACASAPRSAALDPPACRYSKYNSDGPWTMGWYSSGTAGGTCYALGLSVGPQGQSYVGINGGLGGNYKTQLLCNPAGSSPWCPPCQVYSSAAGACVADSSKEGYSCCGGGRCQSGYCTSIPFPTRVGTCGGSTVQSCDGWASGQFCSGCTIRALYKVATRAIPYLHPATDYPTRDARITMAAVATYWSLREGVFNKIYNIDGYNNCETCASGNNYQAPLYSCNTLACAAASCPAKRRQCTWQVGPGAVQVINSGYGPSIDYVCTSSLAPSLNYLAPLSNLPCVQETALKAYGYRLSISQILSNVAAAAGVSASSVLSKTMNCPVSDSVCRQRSGTDPYLAQCQCQLDRKAWLLRDPAVSITYSAYEWFGDRRVSYGTTSALPDIASLKSIYQCLSPP